MPGLKILADMNNEEKKKAFLEEANDILILPGELTDELVVGFCKTYPLEIVFRYLAEFVDDSDFTECCVQLLHKIVVSTFGKSQILHSLPQVKSGLSADFPSIRELACKSLYSVLCFDNGEISPASLLSSLISSDIFPPLIETLSDENVQVAWAASQALEKFCLLPEAPVLLLENEIFQNFSTRGDSTVRIRALSLLAKLIGEFGEELIAEALKKSLILRKFVGDISQTSNDFLSTVGLLQVIPEFTESLSGAKFLLSEGIVPKLRALICSPRSDGIVRSAAMAASGKLLLTKRKEDIPVEETELFNLIQSIDQFLVSSEGNFQEIDGFVTALDSLGQLGESKRGAEALLTLRPIPARHLAESAFESSHYSPKKIAALHSLASISGTERTKNLILLSHEAEENLRKLLYSNAANSAWGPTLAGAVSSLLKQPEEVRRAVYRLLSALVARPWAVYEFCSKSTVLLQVVDSSTETSQTAMEWRHACCVAMATAVDSMEEMGPSPVPHHLKRELDAAVQRGPFLPLRERREAIPSVATMQRGI